MPFLGSDLLDPNAYVTIKTQVASQDASGGTVLVPGATVEDNVPIILSLARGARDGRYDGDLNVSAFTFSGESANLSRQDTVVVFTASSFPGVPAGSTARLTDVTTHPESPDTWIPARYSGRVEVTAFGAGV